MKLKLASVKSTGSGSWEKVEEHGTLRSQLVKTDILSFSNKNLENDKKRAVLLVKEKGEETPKMISLSERLSNWVRKALKAGKTKIAILKSLLDANIIENEDGVFYLVTKGSLEKGFTTEELADEKVEPVPFESLI